MVSPEGEQLKLVEAIDPKGQNVEGWMLELEGQMRLTVGRKRRTHLSHKADPPFMTNIVDRNSDISPHFMI